MDPSAQLAREYSDKAAAYDRHWAPVIGPMAMPLLAALPLATARYVLDLGAGTGHHLPALARAARRARVVAVDRSHGMLRIARPRHPEGLIACDAQHLALRSDVIDVAVLIFMLFHMPDPVATLVETRRVLRRSGTIGLVTWGRDDGVPGLAVWKEELNAHDAAPDPRDPGVMQQDRMDSPDKMEQLLAAAGYSHARVWSRRFDRRWSVEDLVELQLTCGMASRRIVSLPREEAAACVARVTARLSALPDADLVHRPEVLFALARPA